MTQEMWEAIRVETSKGSQSHNVYRSNQDIKSSLEEDTLKKKEVR